MAKTLKKQNKQEVNAKKRKHAEAQRRYREKKKQSGEPVRSTSPKDKAKQLEQQRQRKRRYDANKRVSKESKEKAEKPFSDLLPVKFAEPKFDSKDQAHSGKVPLGFGRAISLPEKSTPIEEPLFLPNGAINEKLTRWKVVRATPGSFLTYNPQPNFKFGDPITCRSFEYKWRETDQWSREPLNYKMSFEEAARTGKPKSMRRCSKCGWDVSANEEDHKETCAKEIKRRRKETNKLKRAGVWAPIQRRKADPDPKWCEFKVVPLNRNKQYKSLAWDTSNGQTKYWCDRDRKTTRRLNASGMEAYVEFDGFRPGCPGRKENRFSATSPSNACIHSGDEKYFLFPLISNTYLLHWPNFKESRTDEPINYERALKYTAEARKAAFKQGLPKMAKMGEDLKFCWKILHEAARTGESVTIRHCKWCRGGTFLRVKDHLKTCKGYQRQRKEYQQRCKLLQESEVSGEQSLHCDSTYSRWAPGGKSYSVDWVSRP